MVHTNQATRYPYLSSSHRYYVVVIDVYNQSFIERQFNVKSTIIFILDIICFVLLFSNCFVELFCMNYCPLFLFHCFISLFFYALFFSYCLVSFFYSSVLHYSVLLDDSCSYRLYIDFVHNLNFCPHPGQSRCSGEAVQSRMVDGED